MHVLVCLVVVLFCWVFFFSLLVLVCLEFEPVGGTRRLVILQVDGAPRR